MTMRSFENSNENSVNSEGFRTEAVINHIYRFSLFNSLPNIRTG